MKKERLDILMVNHRLAESRALAQRLILAGHVRVDGQIQYKSATRVPIAASISIDQGPRFVSRGGDKLEAALLKFPIAIPGRICADIGASTGGFTDCLIQYGAQRVYAIDVGYGILNWKLRQDSRVIAIEKTNARYLEHLPEPVDLITIDASFISLKVILPVVCSWYSASGGDLIALIKPQFEAGRQEVSHGKGVIRDPAIHARVLMDVLSLAEALSYGVQGLIRSPILGPKGNIEFLGWLKYPSPPHPTLEKFIQSNFQEIESYPDG